MLVAIEGIDGSGKHTQAELLREKVRSLGMSAEILSFPRYGKTLFAKCVAAYLNGEFGDLASVSPQSAALLYAGDRFESLTMVTQLAHSCDMLILDRYVASNLAHQAAKVSADSCQDFISWLARIEYEVFGLPKADVTVYLDMPAEIASEHVYKKKERSYTTKVADIHEKDIRYLARCREVYQILADMNFNSNWISIPCISLDSQVYTQAEVHRSIWLAIQQHKE